MDKHLGKISEVKFGFGGYQDLQLGLTIKLSFPGSGAETFLAGGWITEISEYTKWTEDDRAREHASLCANLIKILKDAKVEDVADLKNKPIEATFERLVLTNWRILTEVL